MDPNKDKIESYYLKCKSIKHAWEYAKKEYGSTFGYQSLQKHMRNHVISIIEAGKASSRIRKEAIKKDIYQDIKVSETLSNNLKYLSEQIEERKREAKTEKQRNEILKFMSKVEHTIELILRFKKEIGMDSVNTEEERDKMIMYCIQDFPVEQKELFLKRWYEYEPR